MDIPKMNFTGDFTMLAENNPNMWEGAMGGTKAGGTKRPNELEAEKSTARDGSYLPPEEVNRIQSMLNGTQEPSYGTTVLNNFSTKQKTEFTNLSPQGGGAYNMPTTPAILPADLTTQDRMVASPQNDVGSMSNPNTLGESLSGVIESVHDRTVDYETKSDSMLAKNKGSAFDRAKDDLYSDYESLTGVKKTENQKSDIERQIESYMEVMNGSYEYYIYSSLLVDSGKSISQTAQTLTKG